MEGEKIYLPVLAQRIFEKFSKSALCVHACEDQLKTIELRTDPDDDAVDFHVNAVRNS